MRTVAAAKADDPVANASIWVPGDDVMERAVHVHGVRLHEVRKGAVAG